MNQGRIWCVVHPTVGLPLLLGSVAATSLIVHACVMTHTTWMSNYWQGNSKTRVSENDNAPKVAAVTPKGDPAYVISIAPVAGTPGKTESSFVVTVAPNTPAATTNASADGGAAKRTSTMVAAAAPNPK